MVMNEEEERVIIRLWRQKFGYTVELSIYSSYLMLYVALNCVYMYVVNVCTMS